MKTNKQTIRLCAALFAVLLCAGSLSANAALRDAEELVPMGQAAGIRLTTEGVLVVGFSGTANGAETASPAQDAGLQEGDVIVAVDGVTVASAAELQTAVERASGALTLTVRRGGETLTIPVTPVRAADGQPRIGVWLRDNMLGIGTLTFYDPSSGVYGALGHGINEADSGRLQPITGGELLRSVIEGVKRGAAGAPGELEGTYEPDAKIGSVSSNTSSGIFGTMDAVPDGKAVPVRSAAEVELGDAYILSCVDGDTPRRYDIRICAIYRTNDAGHRDMLIEVTDEALLAATGGIVQGMSGSPILQDGELVGAVTHVLVNDPTRGYGILIENMLEEAS